MSLAGDGVDGAFGRGGDDDLAAALAQNGDGLRADQAGTANDDDIYVCPPVRRPDIVKWVRNASKEDARVVKDVIVCFDLG